MKFSFFSPYYGDGGVATATTRLAEQFSVRGHETDLVTFQHDSPFLEESPFRVVDLNAKRTATSVFGLVRYLRRERPDVLLSTHYYANVVSVLAVRLSGTSPHLILTERLHVGTVLRDSDRLKDRVLLRLMQATYQRADSVVTVSEAAADDLSELVGIPRSSVKAIYNPTLVNEVFDAADHPVNHPWFEDESKTVLLGVGRLAPEKDFETLLRAFDAFRGDSDVRLVILGEGPERPTLEDLASELGIEDSVDLHGFVDNPYTFMRNADLFVLSSQLEGMPNVLVEALALGTPVVATDCPSGPRELLDGGHGGELVPVGDDTAMAEAIRTQLANPERAASQVEYVQPTLEKFRPECAAERYLNLVPQQD